MRILVCLFISVSVLCSCNTHEPSFWFSYHPELIKEKVNTQGSYGGHTTIYWKEKPGTFKKEDVIALAEKNNWICLGMDTITAEDASYWTYMGKNIFPLSHTGYKRLPDPDSVYTWFPRYITSGFIVYKFITSSVAIEPGTDNATTENGFIIISDSLDQMQVFHLWGE